MAVNHGFGHQSRSSPSVFVWILAIFAGAAGTWLRFRGDRVGVWLDEAQTVAIAKLPPDQLIDALRADGHPPAFYFLLHVWMDLVGTSDASLRLLPAVFGILAIPVAFAVARRLDGALAGVLSVAVVASSPFLIRFSTEIRMYSLVTLLSLLWWLAVQRAEEKPTPLRLGLVALSVALLVVTHYWALFLFAAWLILAMLSSRAHRGTSKLVAAHAVGGLAFIPWLPTFRYQMAHTGTPWAAAQDPASIVVTTLSDIAGGREEGAALALLALLFFFCFLGFAGKAVRSGMVELDLAGRRETRSFTVLILLTLGLAIVAMTITGSAFASRYVAVIAGFVLVLAGIGLAQLTPPSVQVVATAVVVALGLSGGWHAVEDTRSQGQQVAAEIAGSYEDGDVIVACPDQVGPAPSRYLPASYRPVSYPLLVPAERVDWVDYEAKHANADPAAVAQTLVDTADGHRIWLIWQEGYRTLEGQCSALHQAIASSIGGVDVIGPDPDVFEPMWLSVFGGQGE